MQSGGFWIPISKAHMTFGNVLLTLREREQRGPGRMHRRPNSREISGTGH